METMTDNSTERQRFEAWCRQYAPNLNLAVGQSNFFRSYSSGETQRYWLCWRAAWREMQVRSANLCDEVATEAVDAISDRPLSGFATTQVASWLRDAARRIRQLA